MSENPITTAPFKLYIKTYGCQMNVYDSFKMADILKPHGFVISDSIDDADLVILNTCHIREKAAEKVYCELGRIRELKALRKAVGKEMIIVVAGCVAQAEGEEIFTRIPEVDGVVGPQSYQNLPKMIEKIKRKEKLTIDVTFPKINKFDALPQESQPQGPSAFVAIQEGCDKFCHFCVVPYTRGAEYSRSIGEIYREVAGLVNGGAKEIQLLGQNVNAYHGLGVDGEVCGLGRLIKSIASIKGLERIRYTTSHPVDMNCDELFEAHATIDKLMPSLHLPVQSGSDKILNAMNRKHTRDFYLKVIDKFRKIRGDMSFSSDFIIGYPGETDQDFEDTMSLIREVEFAQCYSFKYSIRPGTPASMYENQVPENIKSERLEELQKLVKVYQQKFNNQFLGKTLKVLFEKKGKHEGQLIGRSEHMQAVFAETCQTNIGNIVEVKIIGVEPHSLRGQVI